jgi:hypothetical protein
MRPPVGRWKKYITDAKRRGVNFELSQEEFLSFNGKSCEYCGSELDTIRLDRVDNNLGYLLENVVPCCFKCNSFKHTFEEKEFLDHISSIYLHQNNGKDNGKQENTFKEISKKDTLNSKGVGTGSGHTTRYTSRRVKSRRRGFFSGLWEILSI